MNKIQITLNHTITLSEKLKSPTLFSDCGKSESAKAFCAWYCAQSSAPECPNVKKIKNGGLDQYGSEHSEV